MCLKDLWDPKIPKHSIPVPLHFPYRSHNQSWWYGKHVPSLGPMGIGFSPFQVPEALVDLSLSKYMHIYIHTYHTHANVYVLCIYNITLSTLILLYLVRFTIIGYESPVGGSWIHHRGPLILQPLCNKAQLWSETLWETTGIEGASSLRSRFSACLLEMWPFSAWKC